MEAPYIRIIIIIPIIPPWLGLHHVIKIKMEIHRADLSIVFIIQLNTRQTTYMYPTGKTSWALPSVPLIGFIFTLNPFSTEPVLQIPLFSLAQTYAPMLPPGQSKRCTQIWIDKTATFNLIPSRITSYLALTVSCTIALGGSLQKWVVEIKRSVMLISTGLSWAMQWVRLIVESAT
jgi:hypothetical protein